MCRICDKDLDENEGGLVSFKKRFSDKVWERKMKRIHGVGHPPYMDWFCEKHYQRAKDLKDLTIDKAMAVMNSEDRR
ncbi:MAG: hypothetical protein JXA54_12590 [Candidatus Heimdallarchaeota archaeon]|nr:hypothetical protein [Candidatus Heimdallarchaeota archaeon]